MKYTQLLPLLLPFVAALPNAEDLKGDAIDCSSFKYVVIANTNIHRLNDPALALLRGAGLANGAQILIDGCFWGDNT